MVTGVQQCSILEHRVVLAAATDECTTVWESLSLSLSCLEQLLLPLHLSVCHSLSALLCSPASPCSPAPPPPLFHVQVFSVHQVVPLLSFHRFPREPFFIFSACQSLHIRCSKILVKLCPKKSSSKDDEHYNVQLVVQVART